MKIGLYNSRHKYNKMSFIARKENAWEGNEDMEMYCSVLLPPSSKKKKLKMEVSFFNGTWQMAFFYMKKIPKKQWPREDNGAENIQYTHKISFPQPLSWEKNSQQWGEMKVFHLCAKFAILWLTSKLIIPSSSRSNVLNTYSAYLFAFPCGKNCA